MSHVDPVEKPADKYEKLNESVKLLPEYEYVVLSEGKHTPSAFQNSMQRKRFIDDIKLSVPVDIFRYAPGGAYRTVVVCVRVPDARNPDQRGNYKVII